MLPRDWRVHSFALVIHTDRSYVEMKLEIARAKVVDSWDFLASLWVKSDVSPCIFFLLTLEFVLVSGHCVAALCENERRKEKGRKEAIEAC